MALPADKLGEGLEDRKDRLTIRARLRRSDLRGQLRDMSQSFPYHRKSDGTIDPRSRADAITLARAWVTEQQRAMRFDGTPVGERLQDQTLGAWVQRYIHEAELGVQEIDEARRAKEAGWVREPRFHIPAHARKKGIKPEISVLRGWLAEFPKLMARVPDHVTRSTFDDIISHLRYQRQKTNGEYALLKPKTIGRWLAVLSAVYNTAANDKAWGFVDVINPVKGVKVPRANTEAEQERKGRLVSEAELHDVFAHIPEASLTTRCCIRFLRWTGARRSEAVNLDWSDVVLDVERASDEPTARFRDTKTPKGEIKERTIPLSEPAVAALRALLEGKTKPKSGLVFPINVHTPTRAWIRGRNRAGLDVRLHDMRHTRTTEVTRDLPAIEAQAITGHADIRMLLHYYHVTPHELGQKLRNAEELRAKKGQGKNKVIDELLKQLQIALNSN
jgi:integrase